MTWSLLEVEVTTTSNIMDLDQDIQVVNQKYKNVSLEERHKWRMPELPPVTKGYPEPFTLLLRETVDIYQSQCKKLVYGCKAAGVRTSAKPLGRDHELLSSNENVPGPREGREPSEGVETHLLQRTTPKDESLVEKPKHFVRRPEERQNPSEFFSSLKKQESS
ncbi:hypothetical protein O181_014032 [Austropuccinia psidii MF-1]|uniref:Uncharacterized protein n=1 Tax=Austropuccinia psidii MF-1 TaxID=1389203 RepID=A0A9Q3C0V5_9BASI|nr:hypothetical protein [Austropuccinia psidii MF-1]